MIDRLGRKLLQGGMAVQRDVLLVLGQRPAGALVGLAVADATNQVLAIVAGVGKLARQQLEQLRMRWRLVGMNVVNRVHQTTPEKVSPKAIGGGLCEPFVLLGCQPLDECRTERLRWIELGFVPFEKAS